MRSPSAAAMAAPLHRELHGLRAAHRSPRCRRAAPAPASTSLLRAAAADPQAPRAAPWQPSPAPGSFIPARLTPRAPPSPARPPVRGGVGQRPRGLARAKDAGGPGHPGGPEPSGRRARRVSRAQRPQRGRLGAGGGGRPGTPGVSGAPRRAVPGTRPPRGARPARLTC